jgi:hypothetical protein
MTTFPETYTACVVSTAHLPEEVIEYLDTPDASDRLIFEKLAYGYRIWTKTDTDAIPNKIRPIVLAARKAECKWIEFDQDADEIEGFKTWEW